jgi:propanediol dehydratase small subunit
MKMDNLEKMMQQILAQINSNQEKAEAFQEKMDYNLDRMAKFEGKWRL